MDTGGIRVGWLDTRWGRGAWPAVAGDYTISTHNVDLTREGFQGDAIHADQKCTLTVSFPSAVCL